MFESLVLSEISTKNKESCSTLGLRFVSTSKHIHLQRQKHSYPAASEFASRVKCICSKQAGLQHQTQLPPEPKRNLFQYQTCLPPASNQLLFSAELTHFQCPKRSFPTQTELLPSLIINVLTSSLYPYSDVSMSSIWKAVCKIPQNNKNYGESFHKMISRRKRPVTTHKQDSNKTFNNATCNNTTLHYQKMAEKKHKKSTLYLLHRIVIFSFFSAIFR